MRETVVRIAALGLSAQIGMSLPLWLPTGKNLPPKTAFSFVYNLPDGVLLLLLFSASVALVVTPQRRWTAWAVLAAMVLEAHADVNRLQPWFYFYFLVLAASIPKKTPENGIRWVIAAVYFWSGFYKLTPWYAEQNHVWFSEALPITAWAGKYHVLGYAAAVVEMALGAGLLWPRGRNVFRWLVLLFHAYVIVVLSPLGADWNHVVIPWNLAMAALVWVVFAPDGVQGSLRVTGWSWAPVFLGVMAPVGQLFQAWPSALSWTMYSNTQTEVVFYNNGSVCDALKPVWDKHAFDNGTKLLLDEWSMATRQTPLVNHTRNYYNQGRYLCDCTETSLDSTGVYFLTVNRWKSGSDSLQFVPCSRLRKALFLF